MRYSLLWILLIITLLVTFGERAESQELSTEVFPSEDELLQALELGEISLRQFILLNELVILKLDSMTLHQLDLIPDLSYFGVRYALYQSKLESEQVNAFLKPSAPSHNELRWRISGKLEEERSNDTRYRLSGRLQLSEHWRSDLRIHREFGGRERWVRRSISYRNRKGSLRRLIIGNFSERYALGGVLGYRGKLFNLSDNLDGKSLLFPDYGGANGLAASWRWQNRESRQFVSLIQGSEFELLSIGGTIKQRMAAHRPGIVLAYSRLRNRTTDQSVHDYKASLFETYRYANGYSSAELIGQGSDMGGAAALLVEGRHALEDAEIRYAGWLYSERFSDFTSGGKAAALSRHQEIQKLAFRYTSKRSGQRGLLVRTIVHPKNDLSLTSSFLYGGRNSVDWRAQAQMELAYDFNAAFNAGLLFLGRYHSNEGTSSVKRIDRNELRIVGRIKTGQVRSRAYIAYHSDDDRGKFASLFLSVKYISLHLGTFDIWSNLAALDRNGVAYWYLYARIEQKLFEQVSSIIKYSHTFSRNATDRNRPVLTAELKATW